LLSRTAVAVGSALILATGPAQFVQAAASSPAPVRPPHDFAKREAVNLQPEHRKVPLAARRDATATAALSVDIIDRNGRRPATDDAPIVTLMPLNGDDWLWAEPTDGHVEGAVPPGDYSVKAVVRTVEANGVTTRTLVYRSKVSISGDTRLTLDARDGRPAGASVDRAGARPTDIVVQTTQDFGHGEETTTLDGGQNFYITPTGTDGGLTYRLQVTLAANGVLTGSPYVYHIAAAPPGIPGDPMVHVRTKDLAAVKTRYASEGRPACGSTKAGARWGNALMYIMASTGTVSLPAAREEYFTPGHTWRRWTATSEDCTFAFGTYDLRFRDDRFERAGQYIGDWAAAPLGPSAGFLLWGTHGEPAMATGMLSSGDAMSDQAPYAHMTGTTVLRDASGAVVASSDQPGMVEGTPGWPQPPAGRYTLTVDAARTAPWSDLAVRQHVTWDLNLTDAALVDLPAFRYRTALDADSRARAGATQQITVVAEKMDPLPADRPPTLRVSFDDGVTWENVALQGSGTTWTASVTNPPSGYVSLQIVRPGVVDQTLIRAYGIRG
jgi:hypothetical protein